MAWTLTDDCPPPDNSHVLAWSAGCEKPVACTYFAAFVDAEGDTIPGLFTDAQGDGYGMREHYTHWMPMPTPPTP